MCNFVSFICHPSSRESIPISKPMFRICILFLAHLFICLIALKNWIPKWKIREIFHWNPTRFCWIFVGLISMQSSSTPLKGKGSNPTFLSFSCIFFWIICIGTVGMAAEESRFHVLAVDDSLIDRKVIERLLKTSSYQGKNTEEFGLWSFHFSRSYFFY